MNFEPQKFFIGLMDFFSILMPGALIAFLSIGYVHDWLKTYYVFAPGSFDSWAAFLFAAYLFGNLAFLLGSFLDDHLYDRLRQATGFGQIKRLAKGNGLSPSWMRQLAESNDVFGPSSDNAVREVLKIKARALDGVAADNAINAFQWSKARLSREHPEGLLAVEQFEASSKFFRSFAVVLAAIPPVTLCQLVLQRLLDGKLLWLQLAASILLLPLVLWRYIDQRYKSTEQAYRFIITLESVQPKPKPFMQPLPPKVAPVIGVVFRRDRNTMLMCLLVRAKDVASTWSLPQGEREAGESEREAAVRIVKDASDQWAQVLGRLEPPQCADDGKRVPVRAFLMRHKCDPVATARLERKQLHRDIEGRPRREQQPPYEPNHLWLTVDEALKEISSPAVQDLLRVANNYMTARDEARKRAQCPRHPKPPGFPHWTFGHQRDAGDR